MADVLDYDKPMVIFDYHNSENDIPAFVSFNCPFNPPDEYCFEMKDVKEAERLADFLTKRTPISLYRPIKGSFPSNE